MFRRDDVKTDPVSLRRRASSAPDETSVLSFDLAERIAQLNERSDDTRLAFWRSRKQVCRTNPERKFLHA